MDVSRIARSIAALCWEDLVISAILDRDLLRFVLSKVFYDVMRMNEDFEGRETYFFFFPFGLVPFPDSNVDSADSVLILIVRATYEVGLNC